ncbi:MAG TPA: DNA alkylation repair protein [Terriglobia bacterium]|nr:DNA alkylation repair protein [Terriglobia bacterium]
MPEEETSSSIIRTLRALAKPRAKKDMERFGIFAGKSLGGISTPALKKLARQIGRNHQLADELWKSGIREARHVAHMIDEPERVTEKQMERWAKDFDSWDIVDGCCLYLFCKTPHAHRKAVDWSKRKEEFVKRAAFSLMAYLAVHDKNASEEKLLKFLPIIQRESIDERNFVKKAVNWALRQIGKRNVNLNQAAIKTGEQIRKIDSRSARWIAADALRELKSAPVQARLHAQRLRSA